MSAEVISIGDLRRQRQRREVREAYEAEQERHRREASERLHRLLDGASWPPFGGDAA